MKYLHSELKWYGYNWVTFPTATNTYTGYYKSYRNGRYSLQVIFDPYKEEVYLYREYYRSFDDKKVKEYHVEVPSFMGGEDPKLFINWVECLITKTIGKGVNI